MDARQANEQVLTLYVNKKHLESRCFFIPFKGLSGCRL